MSNYSTLTQNIQSQIKQNGTKAITGQILQTQLLAMITSLGAGYQYMGVAALNTNPGSPDYKCFYIATAVGTYSNFGSPALTVSTGEVAIFYYDTAWHKAVTGAASKADVDALIQTVESEVSELGHEMDKLDGVDEILGAHSDSATLDSTDLVGLLWDGTKFIAGTSTYDAFVIKVKKGQTFRYSVIAGSGRQVRKFNIKPGLNVTAPSLGYLDPDTDYTFTEDIYVFAQFNISQISPEISYSLTAVGLCADVETISEDFPKDIDEINDVLGAKSADEDLDSSDLAGLLWNGTKFLAASTTYNGFVIKVKKGQTFRYSIIAGSGAQVRRFNVEPGVGVVAPSLGSVAQNTDYIFTEDMYIFASFNISQTPPEIEYTLTATGLCADVEELENEVADTNADIAAVLEQLGGFPENKTLTSADFDNILWDGTKYVASNTTFNSFVVHLVKGQTIKRTKIAGEPSATRVFSVKPQIGVVCSPITTLSNYYDVLRYTATLQDEYILFTYTLPDKPSPKIRVEMAGVGVFGVNQLYGKKIVCFGDSVTEGVGAGSGQTYPQYLSTFLGCEVVNGGFGGTRFKPRNYSQFEPGSEQYNNYYNYHQIDILNIIKAVVSNDWTAQVSAVDWLKNNVGDDNTQQLNALMAVDFSEVDFIVICGGSNDWGGNSVMGVDTSTSDDDFCGAINQIISLIGQTYPNIKIVFATNPVRYWSQKTASEWCSVYQNANGYKLEDYTDKNIELCKNAGIPCLDIYHTCGWNMFNFDNYFTDIAHPGNGYDFLAHKIAGYLKMIWG